MYSITYCLSQIGALDSCTGSSARPWRPQTRQSPAAIPATSRRIHSDRWYSYPVKATLLMKLTIKLCRFFGHFLAPAFQLDSGGRHTVRARQFRGQQPSNGLDRARPSAVLLLLAGGSETLSPGYRLLASRFAGDQHASARAAPRPTAVGGASPSATPPPPPPAHL